MLSARFRLAALAGLLLIPFRLAFAQAEAELPGAELVPATAAQVVDTSPIGIREALILGFVEGVTEFLPVSSTGHLILTNRLLDLDTDAPVRVGDEVMTRKQAVDAYAVIIQAGAIAAVLLLYRRRAVQMAAGLLGKNPAGLRLLINLGVAFLPAVVLGLSLQGMIERHLFGPGPVAFALAIGAVAMVIADRYSKRRANLPEPSGDPLADMPPLRALGIGFAQCAALWPGMSRSMSAMVGGYLAGLRPAAAAEFSFLLGLPTLGGASVYKLLQSGPLVIAAFGWGPAIVGAVAAGLSAAVAVHIFIGLIGRIGLTPFAAYRLVVAGAVVVFLL